jgi:hypothetical protein
VNTANGSVVWQKEFSRQFKTTSPLYGAATSPIVEGGLLIVYVGGHDDGALTAFDPRDGRGAMEPEGRGPGLCVSGGGGDRRRAPTGDGDSNAARWSRSGQRHSSVGRAFHDRLRPERGHAVGGRRPRRLFGRRQAAASSKARAQRLGLGGHTRLGGRRRGALHELADHRRRASSSASRSARRDSSWPSIPRRGARRG